jgi:hypothetical protein
VYNVLIYGYNKGVNKFLEGLVLAFDSFLLNPLKNDEIVAVITLRLDDEGVDYSGWQNSDHF